MPQRKHGLILYQLLAVVISISIGVCSDTGIIIETYPESLEEVTSVRLEIVRGDTAQALIKANGNAASPGWTNPVLIGTHLQNRRLGVASAAVIPSQ